MTLRDDQAVALQALRVAVFEGKKRICMQSPTAWGKTVLAAALVENARAKKKKVLFIVPQIDLVDQTVEMFARQGIYEVGVIQATHYQTDWTQPVQVASVQTLMKKKVLPQADVVIIDECHKLFAFYVKIMHPDTTPQYAKVPIIGLSATPWTKGLGRLYDHYYKASTIQEMIDAGFLSKFRVFAPSHPDLTGVRTVAGDYHEGELSDRMSQTKLVADVVQTWLQYGQGRPTLCYGVDRAHAKKLQQQFIDAGVPCGYQDAFTPDSNKKSKEGVFIEGRKSIKKKFHNGEYPVVCNVATLTTGIDWDVRCISMCRPTKSDMLFCQIVGRGLRTAEGKDDCLILDHSDNHLRLGFVTDIDESYTGLHTNKMEPHENRTSEIRLPKECPQCAYLKPPKLSKCPSCGFSTKVISRIEPEPGELRELKKPKKTLDDGSLLTINDKGLFYAELKGYAYQHGYKEGWAANKYRERTGVWPAWEIKNVLPLSPRQSTANWIKSRAIAWAKSKVRDRWQDQWKS